MRRFTLPYKYYRFMGITGACLVLYIVVIGIFGNVDVTPVLPMKLASSLQEAWPQMPFFEVQKEPTDSKGEQEILYTVPTRQLTPEELQRMGVRPPKKTEGAPKRQK